MSRDGYTSRETSAASSLTELSLSIIRNSRVQEGGSSIWKLQKRRLDILLSIQLGKSANKLASTSQAQDLTSSDVTSYNAALQSSISDNPFGREGLLE